MWTLGWDSNNNFVMAILRAKFNIFTNRNVKVRGLQLINHLLVIAVLIKGFDLWLLPLSLLVYFFMFGVGVNIGVHRYFSHKSFETSRAYEWLFGVCMTLASVGSPLAWVGMHRLHHRFSDTHRDPHTPLREGQRSMAGFFAAYTGNWFKYVAPANNIQDLRHHPMHRFLHFYYFAVILLYVLILLAINPVLVVYCYCLPAVMCFHAASLIVTVGHMFGSRTHDNADGSRNNAILHWLTFGEGLHNAHHALPRLARYKDVPWYLYDLPGALIANVFRTNRKLADTVPDAAR